MEELDGIVIEISLADLDFLKLGKEIENVALEMAESYHVLYTVHAPYQGFKVWTFKNQFRRGK